MIVDDLGFAVGTTSTTIRTTISGCTSWSTPINYRVLFIVFALFSGLGMAGLIACELFMPQNAGGLVGRLAMYRYMGTATFCWASIAIWSWYQLRLESKGHK